MTETIESKDLPIKKWNKITISVLFFFLALIGISLAFYKVLSPFILNIFIAAILTHMFRRPYHFLRTRWKLREAHSAFIITVMILAIVIIPLFLTIYMVSNEITTNYSSKWMKSKIKDYREFLSSESVNKKLEKTPLLGPLIQDLDINILEKKLIDYRVTLGEKLLKKGTSLLLYMSKLLFRIFIIVILVYFLLRDGNSLLGTMKALLPLDTADESELINELIKVTDSTLIQTVIISISEGLFGGLLFALVGIPSAFLWAILMMIFSMIPLIGVIMILLPAAIIKLATGNFIAGLVLLIIGCGGEMISQYIIKPKLMGESSGLHPAILLLATLGGLMWLGLIGFLVGPILAGLFIVIWTQFGRHYQKGLKEWST